MIITTRQLNCSGTSFLAKVTGNGGAGIVHIHDFYHGTVESHSAPAWWTSFQREELGVGVWIIINRALACYVWG